MHEKYEECMKWSAWKQCMYVIFDREQLEGHSFFLFKLFSEEEFNAHSTDPLACIFRIWYFEANSRQSKISIFDREQLERIFFIQLVWSTGPQRTHCGSPSMCISIFEIAIFRPTMRNNGIFPFLIYASDRSLTAPI